MFVQSCPKCGSGRIRRGYQHASIFLRLIRINYLLCDNCNLQFKGFSLFGAPNGSRHRKNRANDDYERWKVNLEVKMFPLQNGVLTQSALDAAMREEVEGYTRDISSAGISIIVPDARFGDEFCARENNRLLVHLETGTEEDAPPIQMQAIIVRCEQLDEGESEGGWFVGTRITWLSPEDQARYTFFLRSLK